MALKVRTIGMHKILLLRNFT